MTVKRAALLTAASVLGAVVLLAALVGWLVATESGLRFAWNRAAGLMPAGLTVRAVEGRLIGPLIVHDVELSTDTMQIALDRAELEWQAPALIGGSFNADRLSLRGLDVVLLPSDPEAEPETVGEPFELPQRIDLPVAVNVETVSLEDVEVYTTPEAEPLVVDSTEFSMHLDGDEWRLHELVVRAPLFDVDGRVALAPRGSYRAEAELDWVVRPQGLPPAAGETRISGDAAELLVEQSVAAPYGLDAAVVVLRPLEQPALDGDADLRVDPQALGLDLPFGTVAATIAVEGGLDDLGLTGRIELPMPDLVDARVDIDGRYRGDTVRVDTLRLSDAGSQAEVTLSGQVVLAPDVAVELDGTWSSLQWPTRGEPQFASRSGTLRLAGTPEDLTVDLAAAVADGGSIDGRVRRRGESLNAELQWSDVGWPQSAPRVASDEGTLSVEGTLDDYTLTLDAGLAIADGTAGHVRVAGAGSLQSLDLEQVDIEALDGTVSGRASFAWDPAVAADVDLTLANLDPGIVSADWRGRVDGVIRGNAAMDGDAPSGQVDALQLSGTLRDRPIELDARGAFADDTAQIDAFELRSGRSTATATGVVGPELDVEWQLDSPDLEDLWPSLAGRIDASGEASGPRDRPVVRLDADAADIDAFGVRVDELNVRADVDAAGELQSQLDVTVAELRYADRALERLDLNASGDAAAHALTLSAQGEGATADLEIGGRLERPWQPDFEWQFDLERATLAYAELAPWVLREPASGRVVQAGAEIGEACWTSGGASLCVDAAQQNGGTRARFEVADLPFQYFATFLPSDTRITGTLAATGEAALLPDEPPRFEVDLTTSRGRIGSSLAGRDGAGLAFGRGSAHVVWNADALEADLDWPFNGGQGRLEVDAAVAQTPGVPFADSALDARLLVDIRDIGFLPDLVAGIDDTGGVLSGDVDVTGTVGQPRVAGVVELSDGTVRLRAPDIVLEELRVALIGDGGGGIDIEAEGRSGGGRFDADGRLNLEGSVPVGAIAVRGEDFELFNTPDARVYVTPDLRLDLTPSSMRLTGEVVVPRASITPRGTTEGAIQASSDQVFVDEQDQPPGAGARPLSARVAIQLGDDVTIEGFGLTGQLAGALEVVETPGEPTTGSGELRVQDGTYVAYGQELEIRTGRLIFAGGALTRPGLDIEAVRRPTEDILVGARVQGTLRQPELSVFSEPSMAQQEQLSYLLLGRPLESASTSENSTLSQAAMALGLRGGNFVSERLNRSLGFDEFGIQTQPGEDANSASFVIGKYLSPSLYVSYGVGLFEPVNTLRLRYTISSRWRLVTESSSRGSGGDLIYHIERGD